MALEPDSKAVIQPGGRLELALPIFNAGDVVVVSVSEGKDRVDVRIVRDDSENGKSLTGKRRFGFARGRIKIRDDFDDPLPGFEEYS